MTDLKYSRQREALLSELRSRHDHPTAEILYRKLKTSYPRLSLGTVYRNLALLCSLGQIMKVPCRDGSEHYDAFLDPHDHFFCTCCGKVIDVPSGGSIAEKPDLGEAVGTVDSYSLIYNGLCRDCYNQKIKENGGNNNG